MQSKQMVWLEIWKLIVRLKKKKTRDYPGLEFFELAQFSLTKCSSTTICFIKSAKSGFL